MTEHLFSLEALDEAIDQAKPPHLRRSATVRPSDPVTSHEASAKAATKAATLRNLVLVELRYGPKTHDELIAALPGWSASGIRTRCRELVEEGRVVADGYRTSALGNRSIVWRAL